MTAMRRQPQGRIRINRNNPIARALVFAYVATATGLVGYGSNGQDVLPYLASYGAQVGNYTGSAAATPIGLAVKALIGGQPIALTDNFPAAQSSSYSLFALATATSVVTQNAIDDDDGSIRRFQFRVSAGKVEFIPFHSGGAQTVSLSSGLSASDLARGFTMGGTVGPGRFAVFQNGQMASVTPGGSLLTPTNHPVIGMRKIGNQNWMVGGLSLVCMWSRTLTDDEMRSLHANPWQLFESIEEEDELFAAQADTSTYISPDSGLVGLTGFAPAITQSANQFLAPSGQSVGLTGYAPNVLQSANQFIEPGQASIGLQGFAPSISQSSNQGITPTGEAVSVTGNAPTVNQTQNQWTNPLMGVVSLTGFAPMITQSASTAIIPGTEAVILTGYAPSVTQTQHQTVQPSYDGVTLTGFAPTVVRTDHKTLLPSGDGVGLVGYAPTVTQTAQAPAPRYATPIGDISTGNWTGSGSLASSLDPESGSGISTTVAGSCEVKLNNVVDPNTSSGQVVRYKAGSATGNGLNVRLKQGKTVIAEWLHAVLPSTQTVFTQVLTTSQCDAITDYSDLRFEFEAV